MSLPKSEKELLKEAKAEYLKERDEVEEVKEVKIKKVELKKVIKKNGK